MVLLEQVFIKVKLDKNASLAIQCGNCVTFGRWAVTFTLLLIVTMPFLLCYFNLNLVSFFFNNNFTLDVVSEYLNNK